jgi:hypothetical protein
MVNYKEAIPGSGRHNWLRRAEGGLTVEVSLPQADKDKVGDWPGWRGSLYPGERRQYEF